ncbi:hypothetical protein NUU61_003112 [Penicillium alfredii]|uniref:Uncharacterized protein n=1 Tax=Penicillium alfredii TaxID=1506179 RepID=A0A9W9KGL8_9EURO|nr:uncharacterized protein NUU61_003112 [Penicillium alfredii]KAJ5105765.1 hypothetical protein NUU61_003112 [Penicillium alfredii]
MPLFPPADAGPNQVREYLTQILILKHDIYKDEAKATANLWQIGRGVDLAKATEASFSRLFGEAVGPFLYTSVHEDVVADWRASTAGQINLCVLYAIPVIGTLFLIRAYRQTSTERTVMAMGEACWAFGPLLLVCEALEPSHPYKPVLLGIGFWPSIFFVLALCLRIANMWQEKNESAQDGQDKIWWQKASQKST